MSERQKQHFVNQQLQDVAEADVSVWEDGRHFIHSFTYRGCKFEPVNGQHLDRFILTLQHMGMREGSRMWDYFITKRPEGGYAVAFGPAAVLFDGNGNYLEVVI